MWTTPSQVPCAAPSPHELCTLQCAQGLHDVASVLLLVSGSASGAFPLLVSLVGGHMRDATRASLVIASSLSCFELCLLGSAYMGLFFELPELGSAYLHGQMLWVPPPGAALNCVCWPYMIYGHMLWVCSSLL